MAKSKIIDKDETPKASKLFWFNVYAGAAVMLFMMYKNAVHALYVYWIMH